MKKVIYVQEKNNEKKSDLYQMINRPTSFEEAEIVSHIEFTRCSVCNEPFEDNGNEYCSYHCATGG
jgi:uncharacterized protein with PIN domain